MTRELLSFSNVPFVTVEVQKVEATPIRSACYYPATERRRHSRNRRACMRLFLAALILIVGTIPAGAQWLDRRTPGIPRKPDGKPNLTAPAPRGPDGKPDLTGVWNGPVPET